MKLNKLAVCVFLVLLFVSIDVYAVLWSLWKAPVTVRVVLDTKNADLSVSCNPATIAAGDVTIVSGRLVNATSREGIPGQTINLYYRPSGGSPWTYITVLTTSSNGTYSHLWTDASTLSADLYVVNATFSGNADYDPWSSITDLQVFERTVTITGRFYYFDNQSNQKPVDRALIELYDEDLISDDLLDSTYTTSDGYFVLGPVENVDDELGETGTRDLYIRGYAENWAGRVYENHLAGDPYGMYQFRTATVWDISDGEHDWGNMPVPEEQYPVFFILDIVTSGYEYTHSRVDSFSASVNVVWHDGYGGFVDRGTLYHWVQDTIHISGTEDDPDEWDKGVILHEYGHFVSDKLDLVSDWFPPEGDHYWHVKYTAKLAWSEGWAHFFSCAARNSSSYRNTRLGGWTQYNVEDGKETGSSGYSNDANSNGGRCEASVAGILWDIYDGYTMRDDQDEDGVGDNLDNKEYEIWDVVLNYKIKIRGGKKVHTRKAHTIFEFWDGWFARRHGYNQEMWDIYYEHGETMPTSLSVTAHSPINIMVTDPYGRRVGYFAENDTVVNEIPNATYSGPDSEPEEITIPIPTLGVYVTTTYGTDYGEYNVTMKSAILNGSTVDTETWVDSAVPEELHNEPVALDNEGRLTPTIRDIAVRNISLSKTVVGQGQSIVLNATVENRGNHTESLEVTVSANSLEIETRFITLANGTSTTVAFVWNTTGFDYSNYTISAYAPPLLAETNASDNTYIDGSVKITVLGDVNGDGHVNIFDLLEARDAIGSTSGDPNWNPNVDLNDDVFINIFDLLIIRDNIGKSV